MKCFGLLFFARDELKKVQFSLYSFIDDSPFFSVAPKRTQKFAKLSLHQKFRSDKTMEKFIFLLIFSFSSSTREFKFHIEYGRNIYSRDELNFTITEWKSRICKNKMVKVLDIQCKQSWLHN